MNDIVSRLRLKITFDSVRQFSFIADENSLNSEAADEIEKLRRIISGYADEVDYLRQINERLYKRNCDLQCTPVQPKTYDYNDLAYPDRHKQR